MAKNNKAVQLFSNKLDEIIINLYSDIDGWNKKALVNLAKLREQTWDRVVFKKNLIHSGLHVYPGSLKIEGNFTFGGHALVLGDLETTGFINTFLDHNILIVVGNLKCRNMALTQSGILVAGKAEVSECFYGSHNGVSKFVQGLKTKIYIKDNGWNNYTIESRSETNNNIKAKYKFDFNKDNSDKVFSQLSKLLVSSPERDEYNSITIWKAMNTAFKKGSILKK